MEILRVRKLYETSTLPEYGSHGSIGLDIRAHLFDSGGVAYNTFLDPGERKVIQTGLALAIPETHYGRIAPRSGLAFKNGIDTMAGVIDSDYRGEIGVILVNLGQERFQVSNGDRIAQLILERADRMAIFIEKDLEETGRGDGGFGSTGVA